MAEDREPTETDDFAASLQRRLRSYGTGVLGSAGALDHGAGSADATQRLVARRAEFTDSLQSLLSHREVARRAASEGPSSPALVSAAPMAQGSATSPVEPPSAQESQERTGGEQTSGPMTFGSDSWFARMQERISIQQANRVEWDRSSGASIDTINRALDLGGSSAPPADRGGRRSRIQEGTSTPTPASEFARNASRAEGSPSNPEIARTVDETPQAEKSPGSTSAAEPNPTLAGPAAATNEVARTAAPVPTQSASAEASERREAPPIVQRKPGRRGASAPVQRSPMEPEVTASPAPGVTPTPAADAHGSPAAAPDAPVVRRTVEPSLRTAPASVANARPAAVRVIPSTPPANAAAPAPQTNAPPSTPTAQASDREPATEPPRETPTAAKEEPIATEPRADADSAGSGLSTPAPVSSPVASLPAEASPAASTGADVARRVDASPREASSDPAPELLAPQVAAAGTSASQAATWTPPQAESPPDTTEEPGPLAVSERAETPAPRDETSAERPPAAQSTASYVATTTTGGNQPQAPSPLDSGDAQPAAAASASGPDQAEIQRMGAEPVPARTPLEAPAPASDALAATTSGIQRVVAEPMADPAAPATPAAGPSARPAPLAASVPSAEPMAGTHAGTPDVEQDAPPTPESRRPASTAVARETDSAAPTASADLSPASAVAGAIETVAANPEGGSAPSQAAANASLPDSVASLAAAEHGTVRRSVEAAPPPAQPTSTGDTFFVRPPEQAASAAAEATEGLPVGEEPRAETSPPPPAALPGNVDPVFGGPPLAAGQSLTPVPSGTSDAASGPAPGVESRPAAVQRVEAMQAPAPVDGELFDTHTASAPSEQAPFPALAADRAASIAADAAAPPSGAPVQRVAETAVSDPATPPVADGDTEGPASPDSPPTSSVSGPVSGRPAAQASNAPATPPIQDGVAEAPSASPIQRVVAEPSTPATTTTPLPVPGAPGAASTPTEAPGVTVSLAQSERLSAGPAAPVPGAEAAGVAAPGAPTAASSTGDATVQRREVASRVSAESHAQPAVAVSSESMAVATPAPPSAEVPPVRTLAPGAQGLPEAVPPRSETVEAVPTLATDSAPVEMPLAPVHAPMQTGEAPAQGSDGAIQRLSAGALTEDATPAADEPLSLPTASLEPGVPSTARATTSEVAATPNATVPAGAAPVAPAGRPSILRSPAEVETAIPATVSDVQRLAASIAPPSGGGSTVAPARTVAALPPEPSQIVQRAIVPPAQSSTPSPLTLEMPRPPVVQRAQTVPEVMRLPAEEEDPKAPDYRKLAEQVWPHLRRQLRLERERERGLPS